MACRTCIELEQFFQSANQSDSPDTLLGLSEAGHRNRLQQRREKIEKARSALEKHQNLCPEYAEASAAEPLLSSRTK